MKFLEALHLAVVCLREALDLHGVPLVDLWSHLVADVLVEVLDLLEDAPL